MLDSLMFLSFVINMTGLFRFVTPQLGISIGTVSMAMFLLNVLYLLIKVRHTAPILLRPNMLWWLFVLVIWPLLTVSYSQTFDFRESGLLAYYCSLLIAAMVYTVSNGLGAMFRVLTVSLIVSVAGLLLSMIMPQYFEAVATIVGAKIEDMGRPLGFYMQPNVLATSLGLLYIGWFALWRHRSSFLEVTAIVLFLIVMLLTGSRTNILLSAGFVALNFSYEWRRRVQKGQYLLRIGLLLAFILVGSVGLNQYLAMKGESGARRKDDLIDRIQAILGGKLSSEGSLKDDASIRGRLDAQEPYWALVREKPLLGHGFGADTLYQERGSLYLSAHSEALTLAMEYGILYPIVFGALMISLYRARMRRKVEELFMTNSILQFVAVSLFLFIINGRLLDNRTFYTILGALMASLYCPRAVFEYDSKNERFTGFLNRRDFPAHAGRQRCVPVALTGPLETPKQGVCQ